MMYGNGSLIRGGGKFVHGFGPNFMLNGSNQWFALIPLACHLIFWIVIILLAVIFWKRHNKKMQEIRKQNDPAMLILRERYAQGEIDTEEYNRRKQDLVL